MDRLESYRTAIKNLLREYSQYKPSYGEVEVSEVVDPIGDHYQLMNIGWNGQERIYGLVLHLDIKDGKIWIQHNGTERDPAQELVEMGVPKSDIVIGFHSPFKRKFTEYAVG
jgi:XisI protein